MNNKISSNMHEATVASFGDEWSKFDQTGVSVQELGVMFDRYFHIFPWAKLPPAAEGFDMGYGSGRWASFVLPRVRLLNCIDPSAEALAIARGNLGNFSNARFHHASADTVELLPESQDFGYSLGVLHHVPDPGTAMASCIRYLKPGAPFLVYMYYRFDNRSTLYKAIWRISDVLRGVISRMPRWLKQWMTDAIALLVYWPLSRFARLMEWLGLDAREMPLFYYRTSGLYTLRTDSRDRFGTPLEKRFTRPEIRSMMSKAGLIDISFSDVDPYWCAVGFKAS